MSASTDCADVPASITSRHITSYGRRAKLLLLLLLLRLSNQLPRRIQADQPTDTHTPLGPRHFTVICRLGLLVRFPPVDDAAAAARPGTRACHFNANASIVRRARHGKDHEPDRISFQFAFVAPDLRHRCAALASTAATRASV